MFNFEKRVIFLDVDGVLNSTRSCVALGGYGHMREEHTWSKLDPIAVSLLQEIVDKTKAKVVLSSSWRCGAKQHQIEAFAKYLGVDIIDCTTVKNRGTRGEEIQEWLNAHKDITHYVIVDDDSDMLPEQLDNFVKVDMHIGLTWQDCKDAMNILGHKCS